MWRHSKKGDECARRHYRPAPRTPPGGASASAGRGSGPVQEGPQDLALRPGRALETGRSGGGHGVVSPGSTAPPVRSCPRLGRSWAGGAGRVSGSTRPGAPYAPGPACSPTPRPGVSRPCSPMSAALRSGPPGASTSARFQVYRVEDPGLGKYLMQQAISSLKQTVPDGLEETTTRARALTERASDTPGLLRPPPHLQRPHARRSTGAWSTYAASPWASATWPATPSAASSTPDASKTT